MRRWMKVGILATGGVAAAGLGAAAFGARIWRRDTARSLSRLDAALDERDGDPAETFDGVPPGLPEPVTRYFEFALTPGQPIIRRARIQWAGEFRTSADAAWSKFRAVQHFTVAPPGFVWDAKIQMAPLVPVRVRDEYIAGEGMMVGKLAALVSVADERGTPEMAAGALSRWLGEAVWFPTALLPGQGVTWAPLGDHTARATVTDGATTVSADFRFGPRGEIVGASMMRYRDVKGRGVLTPFEANIRSDYMRVNGMMIPRRGEVEWVAPQGRLPFWRGRVVTVRYE